MVTGTAPPRSAGGVASVRGRCRLDPRAAPPRTAARETLTLRSCHRRAPGVARARRRWRNTLRARGGPVL